MRKMKKMRGKDGRRSKRKMKEMRGKDEEGDNFCCDESTTERCSPQATQSASVFVRGVNNDPTCMASRVVGQLSLSPSIPLR
jgi:hypothetical protein